MVEQFVWSRTRKQTTNYNHVIDHQTSYSMCYQIITATNTTELPQSSGESTTPINQSAQESQASIFSESSEGAPSERHLLVPPHSWGLIFLRLFQPLYLTPDDPQPRHRYRFGLTNFEPLGIGLPSLTDGQATQYIRVNTDTREHDLGNVSCLKMTAEGAHEWLSGVWEDHTDVPGMTCTTVRVFDGEDLIAYVHMAIMSKTVPGAFSYERLTDATP